ncbi:hypothetical protein SEPCBS119000_001879 [Sporothrix epigloea]|uniref:Alpha/gamma-adaptin-binding protein p34 n=1 Tax=Sporothrix epigloea TaxID=1892477 RepID=A0ABP0DD35_9PEZI
MTTQKSPDSTPPEVQSPRRILAVALDESQEHLARVIKDLTGSYPVASPGTGALAGTTQELALETAYYRAKIPVWLDLVGTPADEESTPASKANDEPRTETEAESETKASAKKETAIDDESRGPVSPRQWADAFLADEAAEVRQALGGVIVVVGIHSESSPQYAPQRDLVEHVGRLVLGMGTLYDLAEEGDKDPEDGGAGAQEFRDLWDGVGLVVGVSEVPMDEDTIASWEDACNLVNLEFIAVAPGQAATNEFGEAEKTGIPRLLESLQANDWELVCGDKSEDDMFGSFQDISGEGDGYDDVNFDDPESVDFGFDRDDFTGLRQAIWQQSTTEREDDGDDGNDGDNEIDDAALMESMLRKLQAARLQSELLPPAQRRAMAARVVGQVMKDI